MDQTPRPASGPRRKLSRKQLRYLIWTACGVVALAGVIFAVSALSSPRDSVPSLPKVTAAEQSRKDYTDALAALDSSETTAARQLLEKAVSEDPNNSAAKNKLDELRNEPLPNQPKSKNDTSPAPAPSGTGPFDKPVSDMGVLLPKSAPGFVLGSKLVSKGEAQLPLDPDDRTLAARVSVVLVAVHDRGSSKAAQDYVTLHRDKLYPNAKSSPDVNGVAAKSGCDNGRLAAVLFSRGRYVFEVVVTSTGRDASKVLDVALQVAKTFPTTL